MVIVEKGEMLETLWLSHYSICSGKFPFNFSLAVFLVKELNLFTYDFLEYYLIINLRITYQILKYLIKLKL